MKFVKRPHFDALLHREELSRPQKVIEQNRKKSGMTSAERIINESGENKKPASNLRRFIEWLIIMIVVIILFSLWIF